MAESGAASVRRRRWPRWLAAAGLLLLGLVLFAAYYLQPAQLTRLLLDGASRSLHLDLRTTGPGSYALRPEPRLVLPGLSASLPGGKTPFFKAGAVELALPWDTLRGKSTAIGSIVLKSPDIDLRAAQRWLATQPPSTQPVKLPTLQRGLSITEGTLRGDGWTVEHLNLTIPRLADGQAATLDLRGRLLRKDAVSNFDLHGSATHAAGAGQGLRLDGIELHLDGDGAFPSLAASGHLLTSERIDVALRGQFQRIPAAWSAALDSRFAKPGDIPFDFTLAHAPATQLALLPAAGDWRLRLSFGDPKRQPALDMQAQASIGMQADAKVNARLQGWPDAWPGLPAGLAATPAPLLLEAGYHGPILEPAPFDFTLSHGPSILRGSARLADLRAWVRGGFASLVPPLQATFDTPQFDLAGVQLRGVRVQVSDDPAASTAAPAKAPAPTRKRAKKS